ncbi:MAG: pseudouridine synthase [Bacteroidales bacterium]
MSDSSSYRPRTGSLSRRKVLTDRPTVTPSESKSKRSSTPSSSSEERQSSTSRKPRESFFKNHSPQEQRKEQGGASRFSRKGESNERPSRKFGRDNDAPRAPRSNRFTKDEGTRPPRRFNSDEASRPPRRFNSDDASRPRKRSFQKDDAQSSTGFESQGRKPFGVRTHARPYERKSFVKTDRREFDAPKDKKGRKRIFIQKTDPTLPVRLNKFIANSGLCSRREADDYILQGDITVNGEVVTTLGHKVMQSDDVRYNGDKLSGERKVYILLNKPKGYVTTMEDEHAPKTVMDLIAGACKERVYPVGRLDKNTTGVLLFTNDGELTKVLTHPSYNKRKVYQVGLDKNIPKSDLEKLVAGVDLEDGLAVADEVGYADISDKSVVGIEIHSGRNRIVRRMFEGLGYEVKKLDRVYFAGLTKKSLERGRWRFLSIKEVNMLKMGAYE